MILWFYCLWHLSWSASWIRWPHTRFHLLRRIPSSWGLFRRFNLKDHLNFLIWGNSLIRLAAGLRLFLGLLSFLHLRFQEKTSNHGGLSLPELHPSWTSEDHPCSFSARWVSSDCSWATIYHLSISLQESFGWVLLPILLQQLLAQRGLDQLMLLLFRRSFLVLVTEGQRWQQRCSDSDELCSCWYS